MSRKNDRIYQAKDESRWDGDEGGPKEELSKNTSSHAFSYSTKPMDQKSAQSVSACHKCRLHKAGWKGRGVGVGQERVGEKGALNFHSTIFHTITPNLAAVHWDEATEQAKLCFAKTHFVYLHLFSSIRY